MVIFRLARCFQDAFAPTGCRCSRGARGLGAAEGLWPFEGLRLERPRKRNCWSKSSERSGKLGMNHFSDLDNGSWPISWVPALQHGL